jgi:hypothetical protein
MTEYVKIPYIKIFAILLFSNGFIYAVQNEFVRCQIQNMTEVQKQDCRDNRLLGGLLVFFSIFSWILSLTFEK